MILQTIKVATERPGHYTKIAAEVYGLWAIHLTPVKDGTKRGWWSLTHAGSGYGFLVCVPKATAQACLRELKRSPHDWSLPKGPASDITREHREEGRRLREKYQGAR